MFDTLDQLAMYTTSSHCHHGLPVAIEVFGLVRSLKAFRLTGGNKDYLIVGSDSGRYVVVTMGGLSMHSRHSGWRRISILQYESEHNRLEKVHMETFGKSGVRRIVPGEFLATDPKGRAVMIGEPSCKLDSC
jgi:splicing factor 3B subunit 3